MTWNRGVKLVVHRSNPARHELFCGLRHVSFAIALSLTELRLLLCRLEVLGFLFIVIMWHYNVIIKPMVTTSSVENHEVVEIPWGIEEFLMHSKKDLLISKIWKTGFAIFSNPFSVSAAEVPQKYLMELIELQCNRRTKSKNLNSKTFCQYIGPTYPNNGIEDRVYVR